MKYAVEMGSGVMIYITKFHKDWFRHSEHRQHGDRISLLLFFQNTESGLKMGHEVILSVLQLLRRLSVCLSV
jgi:hypothetical protein